MGRSLTELRRDGERSRGQRCEPVAPLVQSPGGNRRPNGDRDVIET